MLPTDNKTNRRASSSLSRVGTGPASAWAVALVVALGASVTGCAGDDMASLERDIAEVKARKGGRIEPLPEIKPYESYTYQSGELRSPFESTFDVTDEETEIAAGDSGIAPDIHRRKEALEAFPLDALRMVGTLDRDGQQWAIVSAKDGTIHRVQTGNYLGQNHGQIIRITEQKIELMEIVPKGTGGWQERPANVALSEGRTK